MRGQVIGNAPQSGAPSDKYDWRGSIPGRAAGVPASSERCCPSGRYADRDPTVNTLSGLGGVRSVATHWTCRMEEAVFRSLSQSWNVVIRIRSIGFIVLLPVVSRDCFAPYQLVKGGVTPP